MVTWVRDIDDDTHLVACVQRLDDGSHVGWLRRITWGELGSAQQRAVRAEVGDDPVARATACFERGWGEPIGPIVAGETADEVREAVRRHGFSLDALEPAP